MSRRIVLHVGTHKTGTTSIQTYLQDQNDSLLAAAGSHYPPGFLVPQVQTELSLLTIRSDRKWPARLRFPETQSASWQEAARAYVRSQVDSDDYEQLVYIQEPLSYLRYDDEYATLYELLSGRDATIVVFLRDREDFMRSYRSELDGTGFPTSDDPDSFAYVESDSWLLDYDGLIDRYRHWFGVANVKVFDYDAVMRDDGTVIPAFMEVLGIARSSLPPFEQYRFNQSGSHIRLSAEQLGAIRQRLAALYP